ncbi:MAG TPA: hypothetical protein VE129_01915 [Thermoanaerobaculia bacterium]|nr:hypothetical protein [Thermoanaerobaculia bacterium]
MNALRALCIVAAVLALAGCEPVYEGPQLSEVPEGLAYTNSIRTSRLPLPDRRLLGQYAYAVPGGIDWRTSATISEYEGLATRSEVESVRDAYHSRYGDRLSRYGPVEDFRIDGRPAWVYSADSLSSGKVTRHGLTAVVPWDDRTFSIEVSSEEEKWMGRDVQRKIASSFHIAKKGRFRPILFGICGAAALVWAFLRWRRQQA